MLRDTERQDYLVPTRPNSTRRISGVARLILAGLLVGSFASRPVATFAQEEPKVPTLELSAECFEGSPRMSVRYVGLAGQPTVLRFSGYYPIYNHETGKFIEDNNGGTHLEPTGEEVYPVYISGLKVAKTEEEKNRATKYGLVPSDKPSEFTGAKSDFIIDPSGASLILSPEKTIKAVAFKVNSDVGVNLQTDLASIIDIENPLAQATTELPICVTSK